MSLTPTPLDAEIGRRAPRALNQIGPEFCRALAVRARGAAFVDDFDPMRPWEAPADVDVLLTRPGPGWSKAPREPPSDWPGSIRWVQLASAGIDFYPDWLVAADGPVVTCARGVTAAPIAEYVFAAILGFEKRLDSVAIASPEQFRQVELGGLEGRTLGLYGFGAIGRAVAARARAFDMAVVAARRDRTAPTEHGVTFVEDVSSLVAASDHLVLAAPLTPATRGAVGADALAHARPGLFLVNPARGALIDQAALLAALDDGRVAGAVLDATDPEPLPAGHPLYTHPKARVTPHISWQSSRNSAKLVDCFAANIDAYVEGRPLAGVVDPVHRY
jgi:phosphoglycerate dehydrogenase-like enzyme